MFEQLYTKQITIQRYLNAPLLEARLNHLTYRAEQGTSKRALRATASYHFVAMKYLGLKDNQRIFTHQEVKKAASRWARHEVEHQCFRDISHSHCKARFIQYTTNWLRFLNRLETPTEEPVPDQVTEFIEHERNVRDLAEVTIRSYRHQLKRFFSRIKEDPAKLLARLTPESLDKIFIQQVQKKNLFTTNDSNSKVSFSCLL